MSDWANDMKVAEAAAASTQRAEEAAEGRFDAVHAQAEANANTAHAVTTDEFREWMAARHATDAAWGAWSVLMDARPQS